MLFGNVAVQKVAPSFLVSTFCPSIMPPSPRDGQHHFYIALGKSRFPAPTSSSVRKYE
jgi:hypothetical protein